jgi:hypothetical protein
MASFEAPGARYVPALALSKPKEEFQRGLQRARASYELLEEKKKKLTAGEGNWWTR